MMRKFFKYTFEVMLSLICCITISYSAYQVGYKSSQKDNYICKDTGYIDSHTADINKYSQIRLKVG